MSTLHVAQAFQPADSGDFPVARSSEPLLAYSRTVSSFTQFVGYVWLDYVSNVAGETWSMMTGHFR
jgi:hypothetical protein